MQTNRKSAQEGNAYALFPVWRYRYTYRNKEYCLHVNGQTGKLAGETPFSAVKVISYCATVFFSLLAMTSLALGILEVL